MFKKIWFKFSGRVSLKILMLRTPRFGCSYPQGVRVPPVKNHWHRVFASLQHKVTTAWGCFWKGHKVLTAQGCFP